MTLPISALHSPSGEVWIMLKDRVLLYIAADGSLHAAGDVHAHSTIPSPPVIKRD